MDLVGRMQVKQSKIHLFLRGFCQLIYTYIRVHLCIYVYLYIHIYKCICGAVLIKTQHCNANGKKPIPKELRTIEDQTESHKNCSPLAQGTESSSTSFLHAAWGGVSSSSLNPCVLR